MLKKIKKFIFNLLTKFNKIGGVRTNNKRLSKLASFAKGDILDLGYADHPNTFLVGDITGFDLNDFGKPKNYSRIFKSNFLKIDKILYGKKFDTIVAGEFIEHLENHSDFFRKCNFLLTEGGRLVLSTPNPYYYKTLIGNWFFQKGRIGGNHISVAVPRILNNAAYYSGFKIEEIKRVTGFIWFFSWQTIYVYKKVD